MEDLNTIEIFYSFFQVYDQLLGLPVTVLLGCCACYKSFSLRYCTLTIITYYSCDFDLPFALTACSGSTFGNCLQDECECVNHLSRGMQGSDTNRRGVKLTHKGIANSNRLEQDHASIDKSYLQQCIAYAVSTSLPEINSQTPIFANT